LEGQEAGHEVRLELPPPEAFGEYDPLLVRAEPRANLPSDVTIGRIVTGGELAQLQRSTLQYRVLDITDTDVVLDANHPFAGKPIVVQYVVVAVRAATQEEISQGHLPNQPKAASRYLQECSISRYDLLRSAS
jgi:FKBP-type peptidyl-prolyl cis-trans isomerase SlyD